MAYIYNISFFSETARHEHLVNWLNEHVASAMKENGQFTKVIMTEVVPNNAEQAEVVSLAVQGRCDSTRTIERWEQETCPTLFAELFATFGDAVMPMPTVLKILE